MSKSETSRIENDHTARVMKDDELDLVSGGLELENCHMSNFMAPKRADFIVASYHWRSSAQCPGPALIRRGLFIAGCDFPHPARHRPSRCFASAFFAPRMAAEGRPFQGRAIAYASQVSRLSSRAQRSTKWCAADPSAHLDTRHIVP